MILFQSQYKKPDTKNTRKLLQQSVILNDTDITDNDDAIERTTPRVAYPVQPLILLAFRENHEQPTNTSLSRNPSTSEKSINSESENLQLQLNQKTYPSVMKQSLSFYSMTSHFSNKHPNSLNFLKS